MNVVREILYHKYSEKAKRLSLETSRTAKLKLVWGWIKQGHIDLEIFEMLLINNDLD